MKLTVDLESNEITIDSSVPLSVLIEFCKKLNKNLDEFTICSTPKLGSFLSNIEIPEREDPLTHLLGFDYNTNNEA